MKRSRLPRRETEAQQELTLLYARLGVVDRLIDLLEAYGRVDDQKLPAPMTVAPEIRVRRRQAIA